MSQPVSFSSEEIEVFARCSHDRNPLHVDPVYARATHCGQPVVYGVLAALK
ncbi:MAG: MaoC/PaaZ C-terminal domain-containing protein, partial [Vicinamibacterales bacterium]